MFTKSNFRLLDAIPEGLRLGAIDELAGNPAWGDITFRQDFPGSPHKDTRAIAMRGPEAISLSAQESLDAVDYGYDLPFTQRCIEHATASLPIREVGRIFVVSLRVGGHITRHADQGAYAEHYSRMHVVLQSFKGNDFQCGEETISMPAGTVWTFNHHEEHEVWNNSKAERIHIIIDYKE